MFSLLRNSALFLAGATALPAEITVGLVADTGSSEPLITKPPADQMTPAQKSFWTYITYFHRLPNNPTALQRQIFATTGAAPDFKYIRTSPSSLFSDVEGMKSFRPVFAERYPWVQKLLDQEKITLRVDEELYQGSTEEILVRCQKKFSRYGENHFQPNNRKTLTQNWLEALLVVDFLFACGSHQDRIDGQKLLEYVFDPVAQEIRSAEGRIGHSQELEIPAIFDLAIALADDYPQHATENLVNSLGIFLKTCKQPVDFAQGIKWIIRNAEFKKWPEMQRLYCNLTNNLLVEQGLLSEAIYWNHLKDGVRPSKGSGQKVVEILFMRIFQEKGSQEYAKYLTLLDQAYPEGNPPSN